MYDRVCLQCGDLTSRAACCQAEERAGFSKKYKNFRTTDQSVESLFLARRRRLRCSLVSLHKPCLRESLSEQQQPTINKDPLSHTRYERTSAGATNCFHPALCILYYIYEYVLNMGEKKALAERIGLCVLFLLLIRPF